MTREEVDALRKNHPDQYIELLKKTVAIALDALRKQEPQRVVIPDPEYEYICECPSCGCSVIDGDYCKHCGQRLDWWDEEE